ncbi:hypothetical protein PGB90_004446 [Kerria lacca]
MSDIIRNDYSTKKWRESKQLLLTTVFIALFMDSMLATTVVFAIGETYEILFLARSIHGIATSCTLVAGMGALSARYKKQQKRDDAIRLALGGSALGFMVGPPFGAFMYEYYGKTTPFAVLSGISLIEGGLELIMKQPKLNQAQLMKPSLWVLLKDPYIVIAARLSLLADTYQNQKERGTAIGVALDGLALGNLLGPLFGGIMYELIGKTEPFLILTTIAFGSICKINL